MSRRARDLGFLLVATAVLAAAYIVVGARGFRDRTWRHA